MVCPTLISVSLTPGPYCFWASAGCADNAASARPSSPSFRTNIGFLHVFCCGRSVRERQHVGKPMRGLPAMQVADPRRDRSERFPAKLDTGSREENPSKQEVEPPFRFDGNGGSGDRVTSLHTRVSMRWITFAGDGFALDIRAQGDHDVHVT